MILDMIQGCRYLRRSTNRWLLSKNSTTRLEGLESWHGAGLLWNCSIPITNTKGLYLYPVSNTTPSRPWLQYLLPKTNNMTSCRFRIHHQLVSPLSLYLVHVITHSWTFPLSTVEQLFCQMMMHSRPQTLLTECVEGNLLSNGTLLPNSAHMSVSSCTNFWC
jgi:hypothetical protein